MIHGIDAPFHYCFQKLHCSYHIYSYDLWQEKDFAKQRPTESDKKSACCIEQNGFLKNHNYFFIALFHLYLLGVKEIKALWTRAHSSSHAKSWTTPKKIRHDRFRSPGLVMADLLCSILLRVTNQTRSLNGFGATEEVV
ncbi:hypothetical protein [Paenibacillus sp. BJ-4]|uniref:hypothetical protein n=1 Tax=Paenibacillus sp. BJ-4 TaxID=2878097 RepID=UPI001CF06617|nr:hypothetical protein [Paenibacillus sp. BJ-4]